MSYTSEVLFRTLWPLQESRQGKAFERAVGLSRLGLLHSLEDNTSQAAVEPCDQPKRDPAASQSQRADKSVPASQTEPKGRGHSQRLKTTKYCRRGCLTTDFKVRSHFRRHVTVTARRRAS